MRLGSLLRSKARLAIGVSFLGVVAAGAARKLLRNEVTAPAVRESVAALLGEPGYRLAAERIAAEIAAMPPPAQALAAITTSMP